jgi:BirA family biotin operon repressor/biotin-[acetyl-CoA-carboxylase] ligase
MTQPREEWQFPTRLIGRRVLVYERVDSTNTLAAQFAADPGNDGLVIVAGEQTAGRGQHGRTWESPPGTSVLLSVLLFPSPSLQRPALLTAWAALSVCRALEEAAGVRCRLRWPNDVYVEGKKICGILIERSQGTVAGIGVNINQGAEQFENLPLATSLFLATGRHFDAADMARRLIAQLDAVYHALASDGREEVERDWRERFGLLDEDVCVELHGATLRGRLVEMTFAELAVLTADDALRVVQPEAVLHMRREEG